MSRKLRPILVSLLASLLALALVPTATAHDENGIHHVEGDVQKPIRISGDAPSYTDEGREARIQGVVVLKTVIDTDGRVESVEVLKTLPAGLDQAAVDAVRTWRFEPARLDDEPVKVYYNLTINFRLDGHGEKEKPAES